MSSPRAGRISRLPLLLLPLLASGCAAPGTVYPPRADLVAVTEPKPVPRLEIVTSQQAADQYSADVENWGDRVSAAGGRLCRFYQRIKMPDLSFCPPAK